MRFTKAKTIVLFLGIGILSGCANTYQTNTIKTPPTKISANSKFYVTKPKDGVYGNTNYAGSGQMASAAIAAELSKRGSEVAVAETVETIDTAKERASSASADYLFVSKILHWEDRATEWSLLSDKITMNYAIIDARSGERVASTTASATSGLATFGGDHPQDLLPKTIQNFLNDVME